MTDHATLRLPMSECPYCEQPLDAATAADKSDAAPKPHDITVCLHCSQVLQFDKDMRPQKIDDAALAAIYAEDPAFAAEVRKAQRMVRSIVRREVKR